ncbi:unnamed protein product [Closterium sp. NIES-53]
MDVWGPARVRGQGHERYFLLVVDDYSRYTTVFPLRSKGDVTEVLIDWIRAACLRLRESFGSDFPVLRLHSDRGGEFSSARLGAFCRAQGIRQTFTLPASPQQSGIAERCIGMVMDVARTSMIHAAAPHFLWPFAVQYAAHQLNLQPRLSLPETSPTLLWTGKVGDASAFRVWGSRAFVRDLSADKLSPCAVPCVFLGFPPDAPGWQFYHPTSRRVLSSQDVTFDESVPYYRLFPYRTASLPPPPLFLAPGPPPVDPRSLTPFVLPVLLSRLVEGSKELVDDLVNIVEEEGELSAGEESTDNDVVEVPITKPELRRTGRARRTLERLSFHACPPPATSTAVYDEVGDDLLYDDAEEDDELSELDPDIHADPEHRWDISTMTVKEALTSWKGEAVKAAMEEEIRSLIGMGTWELVKRPRGVNIMKNRWVLTTKYRLDDTVEREKARLVVKGFTQVCGADYDETYSPVSSYVTLRIFFSIVAVFDFNLMQLDMKNAFFDLLGAGFLLAEFKLLDAGKLTILRVDNKSAITVAEGLGLTGNLKHMERRYGWLQHMVRRGKFVLKYIPTTEQPADFLTKALHFPAFNRCSVAIGQVRLVDVGDGDDDVQQ